MADKLFGTDGVRGLAGKYPLDDEGAKRIGMAVGQQFTNPGDKVVIAADTRESSPQIVAAVTRGLNAMGVNVVRAGVIPTPGLAYITKKREDFVAGVMVTASHNPFEYNGIKVFDSNGDKLSEEIEDKLNTLIIDGVEEKGSGEVSDDPGLIKDYEDFLVSSAAGTELDFNLALDMANGSAAGLATRVFERLGAHVSSLFDNPDGHNINQYCGATNTKVLAAHVVDQRNDLGIAFDGDADRVIFIDNKGNPVKGDQLLYILAITRTAEGVVATVMSNYGFEQALKAKDIELIRTAVGDHNVIEELKTSGYKVGGEESGHIVLPELLQTGDGILAAVQVLKAIKESGRSLSDWANEVKLVPQALVNIPLEGLDLLDKPSVKELIELESKQLAGSGRLLVRPSGTEPLLRVMVEADDAEIKAEAIAAKLKEALQA